MVKSPDTRRAPGARAGRQRGYALVALLALMTVTMIAAMAVAPSVRHQSRRDLEAEAIARGEEVAEAIRAFYHMSQPNRLPTSMEELQEGVPYGTKKIQVLRASAARDPLSEDGEWRTIKVNDPAFVRFAKDIAEYADGKMPPPNPFNDPALNGIPIPQLSSLVMGIGSDLGDDDEGEDSSMSSSGPFIGVASRSQRASVITYYDIERHDRWVFTPLFR